MFQKTHSERGSVEVVVLVVIVAAIIGLVTWRIAETQKTQIDTQAAVDNSQTAQIRSNEVKVNALELQFTVPDGNGKVSAVKPQGGELASVELVSTKLKSVESSCEGDNTGAFGTLGVVDTAMGAPTPSYSKEVNGKKYGFISLLTNNCYSAELMTAFRETVPKAIVESLESIK